MDNQHARADRLLGKNNGASGGGLPLPEAFREMLGVILDAGSASSRMLHEAVRDQLRYKEERVLDGWGSWTRFCDDLIDVLSEGGFISPREGHWVLTAKAAPGKELVILAHPQDKNRRIRVTFHGKKARAAREAITEARFRTESFISYLEGLRELAPALAEAHDRALGISLILQAPSGESKDMPPPEEEHHPVFFPFPEKKSRTQRTPRREGQEAWYKEWSRTAGWHLQEDAREAWNKLHPDMYLTERNASAFRHAAREMTEKGEMDRRDAKSRNKRDAFAYRWLRPDEREKEGQS